jgi:HlyD family secretion protein
MTRQKILIIIGGVVVGAALVVANFAFRRNPAPVVTVERVETRDLEAIVSASGKIQPKRLVNISADTSGRVVNLAVNEGDRVTAGQFLLQIDPRSLRTRVDNSSASLRAAESSLDQMRQSIETARVQLEQAEKTLARQRDLWARQITTREALERAETDVRAAKSSLQEREKQVASQQARIAQEKASLENAQFDLSKVRIESPIDGIVTRRNIQEGETAVIGTMNNAGTVLLTLADMSVIQAEVEVDETNIPQVQLGQPATITIDALPDKSFRGHVTEIGNSPIQASAGGARQATNFKVVVVIDEPLPNVRPGFTCTADITTATRTQATAVPIPAVAVRELVFEADGQVAQEPLQGRRRRRPAASTSASSSSSSGTSGSPTSSSSSSRSSASSSADLAELKPGQTRKEVEGVFVVRDGKAVFQPIEVGIAGDRFFEVLSGVKSGEEVITGPYNSVRSLTHGSPVNPEVSRTRPSG